MDNQIAHMGYAKMLMSLHLIDHASIINTNADDENLEPDWELLLHIPGQKPLAYSEDGQHINHWPKRHDAHAIALQIGLTQNLRDPKHIKTNIELGKLDPMEAKKMVIARALLTEHIKRTDNGYMVQFNAPPNQYTLCDYDHKPVTFQTYQEAVDAIKDTGITHMRGFVSDRAYLDKQPHVILYDQSRWNRT